MAGLIAAEAGYGAFARKQELKFIAPGLHGDLPSQEEEGAIEQGLEGEEDKRNWVLIGEKRCFEAGITGVQDVVVSTPPDVKVYMDLAKEEKMRIDVYMMLYVKSLEDAEVKLSKADHWREILKIALHAVN